LHLKDRWKIRTFLDLEARLGDLYAAALDEVRYAQPTGDGNRSRWPEAQIWRIVRRIVHDELFAFTSNVVPDQAKRINRLAHSRLLRDQIFGTLASLAVIDQRSPRDFPAYVKMLGSELANRARQEPEAVEERMGRARERYAFT
jgi:hypothetical protein